MNYIYIKVKNKEHSREIQKYLFSDGVKWNSGDTEPINLDEPHLVIRLDKCRPTLFFGDRDSIKDWNKGGGKIKEVWYNKGKLYDNPSLKGEVDWSSAPDWARYAAKDADGSIFLFDSEPELSKFTDMWVFGGEESEYHSTSGCMGIGWRDSLEKRPNVNHTEDSKELKTYRDLIKLQLNGETIQKKVTISGVWYDLTTPLQVCLGELDKPADERLYRVKQNVTIKRLVGDTEMKGFIRLEDTPLHYGQTYYYVSLNHDSPQVGVWTGAPRDFERIKNKVAYFNYGSAKEHLKALPKVVDIEN